MSKLIEENFCQLTAHSNTSLSDLPQDQCGGVGGGKIGFGLGGVAVKVTHKNFTSVREIDIQNFKSFGKPFIETRPSTVVDPAKI